MIDRTSLAKIVGENVGAARAALGATYQELADLAELSESTVRKAESGEVSPQGLTLAKLASAFFCSPGDLNPTLGQLKEHGAKPPPRFHKPKAKAS